MLDENGYRFNVGIIIINDRKQVFWAKRNGKDAWQFPQGGIKKGESVELAMYRELKEETGIGNADVEILGRTKNLALLRRSKEFN
ncbi:NUDIX domain-containing protein [Betaproteobacteria bacterium]|nr:NUDIX domain-containing protein [Betaproteobacteria bacterium]